MIETAYQHILFSGKYDFNKGRLKISLQGNLEFFPLVKINIIFNKNADSSTFSSNWVRYKFTIPI